MSLSWKGLSRWDQRRGRSFSHDESLLNQDGRSLSGTDPILRVIGQTFSPFEVHQELPILHVKSLASHGGVNVQAQDRSGWEALDVGKSCDAAKAEFTGEQTALTKPGLNIS